MSMFSGLGFNIESILKNPVLQEKMIAKVLEIIEPIKSMLGRIILKEDEKKAVISIIENDNVLALVLMTVDDNLAMKRILKAFPIELLLKNPGEIFKIEEELIELEILIPKNESSNNECKKETLKG